MLTLTCRALAASTSPPRPGGPLLAHIALANRKVRDARPCPRPPGAPASRCRWSQSADPSPSRTHRPPCEYRSCRRSWSSARHGSLAAATAAALIGDGNTTRSRFLPACRWLFTGTRHMRNMLFGVQNLSAIDIHLRGRIQPVEDQVDVGARQQRRCYVEIQPVLPALILDPLQLGLVVAKKRVGNFLVGQQVQMNVAGNGGRHPAALRVLLHRRVT